MAILIIVLAAVVVSGIAAAEAVSRRVDGKNEGSGFAGAERLVAGAVAGLGMWLAATWAIAVTHHFTAGIVYAVALMFLIFAAAAVVTRRVAFGGIRFERGMLWLLPLAAWIVFILWRGALLPPQSHDALAYHLPKAAMMVQAHGFEQFTATDPRITTLPANYELLLADVILLTGSDRLVEWIGTLSYLLMLCVAAAMAQRWWKSRAAVAATVLATAMTPLFLLHSGADKNDLLSSFFCVAAVMWGARWTSRGERTSMLLLVLSLVLAAGTKPNAAAIALGLAPFLAWRAKREISDGRAGLRVVVILLLFCASAFLLCGGASYISNWRSGTAIRIAGEKAAGAADSATIRYGDWQNFWQVPYLILSAPFSPRPAAVWVPWAHEYWFWPRYEIYFSHYGVLFTLLLLAAPFAALYHSRTFGRPERLERFAAESASLIAVLIMLPVELRPVGFFGAFTRYLAFVVPVVVAGTVSAGFASMDARNSGKTLKAALMSVLALLFIWQAVDYGNRDRFAPASFVSFMAHHPGRRDIFFNPNRAASVADRVAGPADTIGVYGSFDTWVYPAYGRQLTRHVIFLSDDTTPDRIPPDVQWVIVDRSWNKLWGNAKLTNTGKFWNLIGRGTPDPADVRAYELLRRDPRFKLLFRDESLNQALFWRKGSTAAAPRREDLLPHDPRPQQP